MPNSHCVCELAGYCERHKIEKSDYLHKMCMGIAPTVDCGRKYWIAWEQGMLGATAPENPIIEPERFCTGEYKIPSIPTPQPTQKGFGDLIASALSSVGITEERVAAWVGGECQCAARREKLNRLGAWAKSLLKGETSENIDDIIQDKKLN